MDKLELSECQEKARRKFNDWLHTDNQFFILTGGPGRGKSFMSELLIQDARSHLGNINFHRTATTNKAAKVIHSFSGEPTGTIHSLLGLRVKNNFKTGTTTLIRSGDSKVICDAFILIDEISMVDDAMLEAWEEGTHRCRFLLVGDKDQLAPVNQHQPPVFHLGYTQAELLTVMRQPESSYIPILAEQLKNTINTGKFLPIFPDGSDVVQVDGSEFKSIVDNKFAEDVKPDRFKIVCWKNDTVRAYNDYVRGRHFDIQHYDVGETVVTNQPIISSGITHYSTDEFAEIREVTEATEHEVHGHWYRLNRGCRVFHASDQLQVKLRLRELANDAKLNGSWATYFQAKEFFADLRPVHACTAYKSQGSSYDSVFIDLSDIGECRQWEQVARMLYVAITRAKNKVYLYGELPKHYTNYQHKVR